MGELKIRVKKVTDGFNWISSGLNDDAVKKHGIMANENRDADGGHMLLMTKAARDEMFAFICWKNMNTTVNRVEQGGLLAGVHYKLNNDVRIGVILHAFPLKTAVGTPGFLDGRPEDWKLAYDTMNRCSRETSVNLEVMGWFHTHPNSLPTFFSGTDRTTQATVFNGDFNYGLVLNPHTGSWKTFRGKDAADACCIMLDTDDVTALGLEPYAGFKIVPAPAPTPEPTPEPAPAPTPVLTPEPMKKLTAKGKARRKALRDAKKLMAKNAKRL